MPKIRFHLNGASTEASYEPGMHLLEVLREECGIVSAKDGCAPEGTCGCCLVMVDGSPALSCLRKAEQIDGDDVVTLEGIPEATRQALGDAFVLEGGVQCGFCIPGIIVRAASLIEHGKTGDRRAIAKAPRRPSLSVHGLRAHHRRDPDGRRGLRERWTLAAHRAAAPSVLRGRVWSRSQSRVRTELRGERLP